MACILNAHAFLVLIFGLTSSCNGQVLEPLPVEEGRAVVAASVSDVTFAEHFLSESVEWSAVRCTARCLRAILCQTLTFTSLAASSQSPGSCRLHSQRIVGLSPAVTPAPGTRVFHMIERYPQLPTTSTTTSATTTTTTPPLDWRGAVCYMDNECPLTSARCISGKCLCQAGLYYSESTATCVSSCAIADLRDSFSEYPGHVILSFDMLEVHGMSLASCKTDCLNNASCRTIDFAASRGECCTSRDTALSQPDSFVLRSAYAHFQRSCV